MKWCGSVCTFDMITVVLLWVGNDIPFFFFFLFCFCNSHSSVFREFFFGGQVDINVSFEKGDGGLLRRRKIGKGGGGGERIKRIFSDK